jgi:hypothetical protein
VTLEREAGGRAHGGRVRMRGPLGVRRRPLRRCWPPTPRTSWWAWRR